MSKENFKTTTGRLAKRFTSWAHRYMSMGAKEVLIKSVAQAIPAYVMGVFKLLTSLSEEMNQMIRYFWWEEGWRAAENSLDGLGEDFDAKVSWWNRVPRHARFNQALLARQAWRLIQFPDSLCVQLLKAKYYPGGELIDIVFPMEASPTWRAIEYGLELVKKGII
jgi:hypothetical protein